MTSFVPGYWINETTGVLRPAVEAYLCGELLTPDQVAAIRAYLRQWMQGDWIGDDIAYLRVALNAIVSRADIDAWCARAAASWIDPF